MAITCIPLGRVRTSYGGNSTSFAESGRGGSSVGQFGFCACTADAQRTSAMTPSARPAAEQ